MYTLELDSNVVYAILAAIVAIVLIVNLTRIVRLKYPKNGYKAAPYEQETKPNQPSGWPNQ